jgi:glutathione synthase/RimK-type ligase-like ATP-grasp enzyme
MLIAFVTHRGLPGLAADDRLTVEELRRRGARVEAAVWDDPGVDWAAFDRIVLRSCWDYHLRPEAFVAWLDRMERAELPLWNPASVVRGNVDKAYLADLAASGLQVVPTALVESGSAANLARLLEERGWDEAVVKPTVSASAFRTFRTSRAKAAADQPAFEALLADSGALVQPFLAEVQSGGEWSFVFLGEEYSHAVRKRPRAGDFRVQTEHGGSAEGEVPRWELVVQARAVAERIPKPWLYARVDAVEVDGSLVLMELELTEPSLFLDRHPAAPERFASAILKAELVRHIPVAEPARVAERA